MKLPAKALLGLIMLPAVSQGTVIVNETFADNERVTQNLPDSVQWTYGAHRSSEAFTSLTAANGKLTWDHTTATANSFSAIWGHFASTSPALGETLRLSFTVSFSSTGASYTSDGAFRWALLNSNGNRVTTDFAGNNTSGISSGTTFSTWTGYQGDSAVAGAPNASTLQIRERKGSGDSLFTGSNWDVRSTGNTIATSTADVAVVLDVTRTATGVTIGTSYGGNSISYVDPSATATSFDTIAFFTVDGLSKDIILSNIKVETIPEPASALLGALGFAGFAFRRKRNA